jgi:hypothetical protein
MITITVHEHSSLISEAERLSRFFKDNNICSDWKIDASYSPLDKCAVIVTYKDEGQNLFVSSVRYATTKKKLEVS